MLCFRCGKDIEFNTSGLCPPCAVERGRERQQEASARPPESRLARARGRLPLGWVLFFAAAMVCAVGAFKFQSGAVPSVEEGLVKITEGDRALFYSPGGSAMHSGRVITWEQKSGSTSEMGIALALGYLSEEDYRTLQTKYGSGKRCPASFLNSHVTMLLLVPDDPESSRALKNASADEGSSVELTGDLLELERFEFDGQAVSTSFSKGRAQLIRPRTLLLDGQSLF